MVLSSACNFPTKIKVMLASWPDSQLRVLPCNQQSSFVQIMATCQYQRAAHVWPRLTGLLPTFERSSRPSGKSSTVEQIARLPLTSTVELTTLRGCRMPVYFTSPLNRYERLQNHIAVDVNTLAGQGTSCLLAVLAHFAEEASTCFNHTLLNHERFLVIWGIGLWESSLVVTFPFA